MAKQGFTVKMKLDRDTKGAVRFQEVDEKGEAETVFHKIGTLYLRKTALGGMIPKSIEVIVKLEDQ